MLVRSQRFLLSRTTTLVLILLLLGSVCLSVFFPQRYVTPALEIEKWRGAHPLLSTWYATAGFDHIYTTPWFAALLLLFLFSLLLSAINQFHAARIRTFALDRPLGADSARTTASMEEIRSICAKNGYLQIVSQGEIIRFIRHPWGHWGNFLLHLGIVFVAGASLCVALTQKRATLHLVEGELFSKGAEWLYEDKGLLAGKFALPFAVRLNRLRPEFWPNYRVRQINSDLVFVDGNDIQKRTVSVSSKLNYSGIYIYQSLDFGHVFSVEITDRSGKRSREKLYFYHPESLVNASYEDFNVPGLPYALKGKYYADAERKTIDSPDPLLVLRLMEGGRVVGQASLKDGESGTIGDYKVHLARVERWSGLFFVEITGIPLIFIGFFVIILGAAINYFTPPRELTVVRGGDWLLLDWRALKFSEFYIEERDRILDELKAEKP